MADEAARHRGLVDLVGLMGVRRVAHGALGHALPEMHLVRVEELWNQPVLERLVEVLVAVRAREERLARDLDRRERTGGVGRLVRAARTPGDHDRGEREADGHERHEHHHHDGDLALGLALLHHDPSSPLRLRR
jgi:hypothetical protein